MLVLTRRKGERIVINDDIVITVLGESHHRPGQIKIGIDAPPEVEVHRHEIQESIKRFGRVSYKTKPSIVA